MYIHYKDYLYTYQITTISLNQYAYLIFYYVFKLYVYINLKKYMY